MDDRSIWLLVVIFMCIMMSAYFSATETAFLSINKIRLKTMADDGNKRAAKVLKIADDFDAMISTVLIGNNLVNILVSYHANHYMQFAWGTFKLAT